MLKRDVVVQLPSSVRDEITRHLKACAEKAEIARRESSFAYAMTNDEKQRANALFAAGELQAYKSLYDIFK